MTKTDDLNKKLQERRDRIFKDVMRIAPCLQKIENKQKCLHCPDIMLCNALAKALDVM